MKKKLLVSLLLFLLAFPFSAQIIIANADDLIIQDDGKIVLVITGSNVLGATTQHAEQKQQSASKSNPAPQTPAKTVPLVPAHTESTVKINPPINNDKKVQVTITTGTTAQTSQPATNPPTKSSITVITSSPLKNQQGQINTPLTPIITTPLTTITISSPSKIQQGTIPTNPSSVTSKNVITKTVDQVVAQGANGQPVITIKSDQARQLTIQQGSTKVTTSLPLQIDTLTHSLSVPSPDQSARVSVLPAEALQGIVNKGLLNTQGVNQAKIDLTKDANGVNYTVQSEKKGKLFGIFSIQSPVQVKLSAQTGKVTKISQPLLFNLFGGFIK